MPTITTHPTPNPNSIKLTTDAGGFVEDGMLSFNSKQEAGDHPIGKKLFQVTGVASVFVMPAFLTVTKHPAASWDELLPTVTHILEEHLAANGEQDTA